MILRYGRMTGSDEKRRRILAAAIPVDLLLSDVLARLPAKSIARCRCVCRSWRAAIAGAAFVRRHRELSRARPPSSCMLTIPRREIDAAGTTAISFYRVQLPSPGHTTAEADADPMFEFDTAAAAASSEPDGVTPIVYLTHCDGLVAITTTTDRVLVCNPATQEFVALPRGRYNAELDCHRKPTRGLQQVAPIGFDRWRNSYIVARYFYRTYGESIIFDEATGDESWSEEYVDDIGHEVFTLGGGGSWELTEDPSHAIGGGVHQRPVCTRRGIYYWNSDVSEPQLLRFGLQERTFEVVPRPPTVSGGSDDHLDDMAFLDGKLCYVHAAAGASFDIWMANDLEDEGLELQWSLLCRVDIPGHVLDLYYDDFMLVGNEMLFRCKLFGGGMDGVAVEQQHSRRQDGSACDSIVAHSLVPYFETLVSPTACNY